MAIWTFTQKGGEKKTLRLEGYAAPFGRPRKGAVMKETIKVAVQTTHYPGSKLAPTRHIFGSYWEPTPMNGRWMTRYLPGTQTANDFANEWVKFVRDEQPLVISWGNLASWEGFVEEISLSRESEDEIAWTMSVLLDSNTDCLVLSSGQSKGRPNAQTLEIISITTEIADPPDNLPLSQSLLDQLDNYASLLKGYTAQLVDYTNLADTIETQTFSTVQSFRNVLSNVYTAIAGMQIVCSNGVTDAALVSRQAQTDATWWTYLVDTDVAITYLRSIVLDLDQSLQFRSNTVYSTNKGGFVTAQNGDTWESLSTKAYGGPDKAATLREANGVKYGNLPVAGTQYVLL